MKYLIFCSFFFVYTVSYCQTANVPNLGQDIDVNIFNKKIDTLKTALSICEATQSGRYDLLSLKDITILYGSEQNFVNSLDDEIKKYYYRLKRHFPKTIEDKEVCLDSLFNDEFYSNPVLTPSLQEEVNNNVERLLPEIMTSQLSFKNNLKKLLAHRHLTIVNSDDKLLWCFQWDGGFGGTQTVMNCMMFYNNGIKMIKGSDFVSVTGYTENIYRITNSPKKMYLITSSGREDIHSSYNQVDLVVFENNIFKKYAGFEERSRNNKLTYLPGLYNSGQYSMINQYAFDPKNHVLSILRGTKRKLIYTLKFDGIKFTKSK